MANTLAQLPAVVDFSSASSASQTFGSGCTPGSLLVAAVAGDTASSSASISVADGANAGNYAQDCYIAAATAGRPTQAGIYSIANTHTAALTLNATFGVALTGLLQIAELTGAAISSALDAQATTTSGGGAGNPSVSLTTTQADDTIIGLALYYPGGTYTADSGYTQFAAGFGGVLFWHFGEYNVDAGAAGAVTLNFGLPQTNSEVFTAAAAAYKTQSGVTSAIAASSTSATGALTGWGAVTLTSPLYTGVGGILDPNFWLDSKPIAGTTVFYDPRFITVQPNGEIVSTSNNCAAVVQFFDGVTWALGLVVFTPNLVGYADSASTAVGALSTSSLLAAIAQDTSSASGNLAALGANAFDLSSATATLNLGQTPLPPGTPTVTTFGVDPAAAADLLNRLQKLMP